MNAVEQRAAAKHFAKYWKDKGYEKGESQKFWLSLLCNVFGVVHPEEYISFESQIMLDHTSFIDGMIDETHVLIEQKSIDKDLRAAIRQSDGTMLTPFQQAKRYSIELPYDKRPRWVVLSNFQEFHVYDMNQPNGEAQVIKLANLPEEYYRLEFLVNKKDVNIQKEMELSIQAGELVGKLYDGLLSGYKPKKVGELVGKLYNSLLDSYNEHDAETLRSLNILCVRIVFCLYAEDAGIFGSHLMFHDYLLKFKKNNVRLALKELFRILNTPYEDRDVNDDEDLLAFPYVNGGLFADESVALPSFSEEIVDLLITDCSEQFNWADISPTIFGAVFESTLNPETRRKGGMHYTSVENIHKVIDPLFLDDLKAEFETICEIKVKNKKKYALETFQDKMANLKFLDPACGSGNFLTESYLSLRKLENEVLKELYGDQIILGEFANPIKVNIAQFYGIEINDFAVTVAKTALWIAESQMMKATEDIIHMPLDFLPLKTNAFIHEGNALTVQWDSLVPKYELSYIIGNPPFVGARLMEDKQKKDLLAVFKGWDKAGNLDYVSCWYKKAAEIMEGTRIKAALVSTNSITQGEQVPILWKRLFEKGLKINFAHKTFVWDSEASIKAHVHCVIVGFSYYDNRGFCLLFKDGTVQKVKNINAYLLDAPNVFIESISKPICNIPEARSGNKPIDNGYYLFLPEEKDAFVAKEPQSEKWFRPWIGSQEYINGKLRYCLWLGDCSPQELMKMPECLKRVDAVRKFRLESKSQGTVKLADKPTRFHVETMPKSTFLVLPLTSSERRRYVPIGFIEPNYLASNLVIVVPDAGLYEFGVLTSNVFMTWMRAVAGRLKSDYRITKDNVYNTFCWPNPSVEQKKKIEKAAQEILNARAEYSSSNLAEMYGEHMYLYPKLLNAHRSNDRAVMEAFGFSIKMTESECVAELMKLYQQKVNN